MDLQKLKAELAKPEYASLDDVAAADALAVTDAEVDRETFDVGLFVSSLDWTAYDALQPKQQDHIRLIVAAGSMPMTPSLKTELAALSPGNKSLSKRKGSLGLTLLPEDDEANANALNLVRSTILIDRESIPVSDVVKGDRCRRVHCPVGWAA